MSDKSTVKGDNFSATVTTINSDSEYRISDDELGQLSPEQTRLEASTTGVHKQLWQGS